MALQTPRADGLAVPPNAPGDANNPAASTQELQAHGFWGRWADASQLPNAAANAAVSPAYDLMRPGDRAWVQATGLLYRLVDRGTPGGSDAVWDAIGGGGTPPNPVDWFPGTTELWRWNQTDLSQLDIANPLRFRDDLGINPVAGSITPSVSVGAGRRGENWLRFTTVGGFRGGLVYRLLDDLGAPLELPERYYIYARYVVGGQNTEGGGLVMPWGLESPLQPGYVEGPLWLHGYTGQNDYPVFISHLNLGTGFTQLYTAGITPDINTKTILNPQPGFLDVQYIGGIENLVQARRQMGEDPTANWWWRTKHRYDSGSEHWWWRFGVQTVRAGVAGAADPTSWNGLDMNQAFVGYYSFNALTGPYAAYSDLRVYSFNPDSPGT